MIVFFENGRVGNQLFQYCALRHVDKKLLVLIGMQSLKTMFNGVDHAGSTKLGWLLERLLCRLGRKWIGILAKKIKLIGLIEEQHIENGAGIIVKAGLTKRVYYCDSVFFQVEDLVTDLVSDKLKLKPSLLEHAVGILKRLQRSRSEIFFVHIRRGDYIEWPTNIAPAVLPSQWYIEQMSKIRNKYTNPLFVVLSDDGPYADEMFASYQDVYIAHENEEIEFALMTLCGGGGILSASSFSWWGAYFARRDNGATDFIAPLYWAGHRMGGWLPKGIETSWLQYAPVYYR